MAAAMPEQLGLFCVACNTHGVIAAEVTNNAGDQVVVPAPCPACRPRPTRELFLAVAALGRRLAAGAPR
jgi:hypothetical protein